MYGYRICAVLAILLATLAFPVDAATGTPRVQSFAVFQHMTTADGLPQSTVTITYRDSQGFVWLGTEDGLVRYDGHRLVRYGYRPGERAGLPGNYVLDIIEDAHHDLWIALVDGGLARWSRSTDRFTVYRHEPANSGSLASDSVAALTLDGAGRLWVATKDAGLDVLEPDTAHFEHVRHDPARANSLIDDRIDTIVHGRSGVIWIGTEQGLERVQENTRSFTHCPQASPSTGAVEGHLALYATPDGTVWQGEPDGGLIHRDEAGQVLAHFRHDAKRADSLADDNVRAILRDRDGQLWVGTDAGLDLLDPATASFAHFRHEEGNANSLGDSSVMSLYQDSSGLLWVGTRLGGVDRWNPRSRSFGGRRPAWLAGRMTTSFAEAGNDRIWIASLGGGLTLYNIETGETQDITDVLQQPNALDDQRVMALAKDASGKLWIGTMTAGLRSVSADGHHLTRYSVKPGNELALSAAGVMALYAAPDGRLWVGTHGGGANIVDPATGRVVQLPFESSTPGGLSARNVTSIVTDTAGNTWLATDGGGLDLADASGHVIKVYRHSDQDGVSIPSDTVNSLALDAQGKLWIGTDRGLALLVGTSSQPGTVSFKTFARAQGLAGDTVYGVLVDFAGHVWVSGNNGLTRYDPGTGSFRTYHIQNGLQNEEFDQGAFLRLGDGRLLFGSAGGFNLFAPSAVEGSAAAPAVALMRVDVLGVPLTADKPSWLLNQIDVNAAARIITLEFAALDFTSPGHNRLAYRIPGLSDRWIDLGMEHDVTLTNLPSGDHSLEVRAASADSPWGANPLRIRIHKSPAVYASRAACIVYGLLVLALIVLAWRVHLRRLAQAERVRRLAYFDALTGLPNRQQCMDVAEAYVRKARETQETISFVFLDLNGFKRINDTFGHAVGDEVLRIVAKKLEEQLGHIRRRGMDGLLSRFGGDEFLIVLRHASDQPAGLDIANACQTLLLSPINYQRLEFFAAPSVGIAAFPDDGDTAEAILKHADTAMYQAKSAGGNSVVAYEPAMSSRLLKFVQIEARLRRALHNEALTFDFQPMFRFSDQQMIGAEVLARWHDEELGTVTPSEFIPVAEESGLIIDLGEVLIRCVCRQLRAWRDMDIALPLAINISGKELLHGDPAQILEREAKIAGIPISLVEIEITESVLVQDSPRVRRALDRLRSLGCLLALDDFGTGYSSLSYITRFPPDKVKIDQAFVQHVDQTAADAAVAEAILSLAANLRMTVTAEGIERKTQFDWFRERGCHVGQGFFLSRPLSSARLLDLIKQGCPQLDQSEFLAAS